MVMCARCHKRIAVVFLTHMEDNKPKQEGLCIKCAKELGIKPVDDMIAKMGLSDDDIEAMNDEVQNFMESSDGSLPDLFGGEDEDGDDGTPDGEDKPGSQTPSLNFSRLMRDGLLKMQGAAGKRPNGKDAKAAAQKAKERKYLDAYCTNLTARAREGKLDRIVGRERDLARVIQILCRRQKNNPCLIGEPGVGKTAIAEALAQRGEPAVPAEKLRGRSA